MKTLRLTTSFSLPTSVAMSDCCEASVTIEHIDKGTAMELGGKPQRHAYRVDKASDTLVAFGSCGNEDCMKQIDMPFDEIPLAVRVQMIDAKLVESTGGDAPS